MKTKSILASLALCLCVSSAQSQSLSNLLSSDVVQNVVTAVTGGQSLTTSNVEGTWYYQGPASELTSDNLLTSAAGTLATSQIDSKMEELCTKVGLSSKAFYFTFNSDNSFSCTVKSQNLSGTYTLDNSANTIELKFSVAGKVNIGTMTADLTISGSTMTMLFSADKLLSFVTKVSSLTDNSTISTLSALAEKYDGLLLGFEMKK